MYKKLIKLNSSSVGKQSVSGNYVTYESKHEDATNCMLRYNQIATNHGEVIQINSGRSSYNIEVNQIICSNRSTSVIQINEGKSIGNVQINYGVVGEQINRSNNSANIQINIVDDCKTDENYNFKNRFMVCRNLEITPLNFSRKSVLINYKLEIVRCQLSETSKRFEGKTIIYKICVESYF